MRIRPALAAVILTLPLAITACSQTAEAPASAAQGPVAVASAPSAPQRVDAQTFSGIVAAPGVTVVDVRTPEEFAAGHIDGAVNFNVQGPDFAAQVSTLDPTGVYAVYCRSGNRSQAAVAAMASAGITGIYELESGIVGWQNAGLPIQ